MGKHLKIVDFLDYLYLESPTFKKVGFGSKTPLNDLRELVREGHDMEKSIVNMNKTGWICNTEYNNWPMIRFFSAWGGKPFYVDLKNKLIWFRKVFKRSE